MSQLEQDIKALEERETYYTNDLERIAQSEPVDQYQYSAIKSELETVQAKLAVLRSEQAAQDAQAELITVFNNIVIEGYQFDLRDFTKDERNHQMLYAWLMEREGATAVLVQSYKAEAEEAKARSLEMQERLQEAHTKINELSDINTDLEMKRKASVAAAEDYKAENTRLIADNESLRKQFESTVKTTNTNTSGNVAEIAREEYLKKPAIYNKRWKDELNRTYYTAQLAETGESFDIHYFEIGKYRELSEDEANRFREEAEARKTLEAAESAKLAEDNKAAEYLRVPSLHTPSEEGHQLDQEDTSMGMAGEAVTRAEFEELKRLVLTNAEDIARIESQRSVA